MSTKQMLPVCTSCNRAITPNEKSVKFNCPECGDVIIWRCDKCRRFCRTYECIKCNFQGP